MVENGKVSLTIDTSEAEKAIEKLCNASDQFFEDLAKKIADKKAKLNMIPVSVRFEYAIGDRVTIREASTHCIPEMALRTIRELFEVCTRPDEE